jgi:F0F1-type ATP synthase membrane subunit b/b'
MRRPLLPLILLTVLLFVPVRAQEHSSSTNQENNLLVWKWINFGILAVGLGYLIAKNGPKFFNARSEEIQKAIQDATGLKIEADFRSSEIDRRMAGLAAEIQKLREAAKLELERESQRIDSDTRTALHRIQEHTTREIEALRHQAALAVRQHAVRLATDLAILDLTDHPEQVNQDALIRSFASTVLEGAR